MNKLERFIYKRSLFFITGVVSIWFSFQTNSLPERLLSAITGSVVVGLVIKDTLDDKA